MGPLLAYLHLLAAAWTDRLRAERGIVTTEAVLLTAGLALAALVVTAILTGKATDIATSVPTG